MGVSRMTNKWRESSTNWCRHFCTSSLWRLTAFGGGTQGWITQKQIWAQSDSKSQVWGVVVRFPCPLLMWDECLSWRSPPGVRDRMILGLFSALQRGQDTRWLVQPHRQTMHVWCVQCESCLNCSLSKGKSPESGTRACLPSEGMLSLCSLTAKTHDLKFSLITCWVSFQIVPNICVQNHNSV